MTPTSAQWLHLRLFVITIALIAPALTPAAQTDSEILRVQHAFHTTPPAVLREALRRLLGLALKASFCYVAPNTTTQPK
jgi:hypothetical protein